jgi:hypothetical protein
LVLKSERKRQDLEPRLLWREQLKEYILMRGYELDFTGILSCWGPSGGLPYHSNKSQDFIKAENLFTGRTIINSPKILLILIS